MGDTPTPNRVAIAGMTIAIFIGPFLALLFRVEAGLGIMAVALVATSLVLREAVPSAPVRLQQVIRALVAINFLLALACFAAVIWLVLRG